MISINQYIELTPRKLINMVYSFYNFQDSPEIKKTVDDALKSGGYLVVQDYNNTLNALKSTFKNYKIVYENINEEDPEDEDYENYEDNDDDDDDDDEGGFYVIVFQK